MALILHRLVSSGRRVSDLVAALPPFEMVKLQFPFPSARLREVLRRAASEYAAYPQDLRDGVKVTLPEGWFLLRGSNTEPVMRVVVEAGNEAGRRRAVRQRRPQSALLDRNLATRGTPALRRSSRLI
jgi:phosphomannomutase